MSLFSLMNGHFPRYLPGKSYVTPAEPLVTPPTAAFQSWRGFRTVLAVEANRVVTDFAKA